MSTLAQDLIDLAGGAESITELLDKLPYDELVEIDYAHNRIRNLYHVEGKYFVPVFDGSYQDLYRYANEHMVHPEDRHIHVGLMDYETIMERLAQSEIPGVLQAEFRYRMQNDEWRWVHQVVVGGPCQRMPEQTIRFYVFDVQNCKDRELGLSSAHPAGAALQLDKLTGLMRERDFFARASMLLESDSCNGWRMIAIDVDRFKLFNDWYGREAGDSVLARMGAYLTECETKYGWLAGYLGQDDFCVLMEESKKTIDSLFADLSAIIGDYGTSVSFMPVFGVSVVEPGTAVLDLLDCALLASEAAKTDFKHRVRFFEPSMYKEAESEYRLLSEFQYAIANGEICHYVQPQCIVSTGKIVGVEALARWRKPDGSIVPPCDFIPVLEKYGFIADLDRYVWRDVCVHIKAWCDSGHEPVPVSVNVSKQDIYAFDVVEYLGELIDEYALDPQLLKVEITESAYSDDASKVSETVRRLHEKGFTVLMDDFGSGYSSLNMLDSINVDVIKLDMLFMHMDEANKRKGIHIVESIVNMAKTMDLIVVTEGVETAEQAQFLNDIGCNYVQGYHFYRPMSNADFEQLVEGTDLLDTAGLVFKANDEFRIREVLDRNVYSDSMLNNMLGAVVLFSWDGGDVELMRYNDQFNALSETGAFKKHAKAIQELVDPKDKERFIALLGQAAAHREDGASGVIRFRRMDNSPLDLLVNVFHVDRENRLGKFYGTVHNVTEMNELRDEINLLSQITHDTVVFLKKRQGVWRYSVEIHGLEFELGLTRDALQEELENGSFFSRIEPHAASALHAITHNISEADDQFTMEFALTNARNEQVGLRVKYYCVSDPSSSFSYIVVFRKADIKAVKGM